LPPKKAKKTAKKPHVKPKRVGGSAKTRRRLLPPGLAKEKVFKACPEKSFRFDSTKKFRPSHDIISQDRAVRAIEMGLGIRKPGYNIYVAGIQGTGKTSVIRTFLEKWSKDSSPPPDWIYVHNFEDTEKPKAIKMPAGHGRRLKKQMEGMIKSLRDEIPRALQSEDYENAVNAYLSASNERKSKLFNDLERLAKGKGFTIKSTRMGIETIPVVEGRSLTEKEYGKLSEKDRDDVEDKRSQLEPKVLAFARKVREIEQETSEYVETLRNELGLTVVGEKLDPIIEQFEKTQEVVDQLNKVKDNILENLLDFVDTEESRNEIDQFAAPEERDPFRKYRINAFVDNSHLKGAPVTIESNPTYYNLFGRIDKNVEHGMYLTDFTMIKPGAVHLANGGYLVLNAGDIFKTSSIWDTLKRVLKNKLGFIEDMGEQYSLLPTSGQRPEPIPLDVKVILIGNDEIYHILFEMDEDFHKIFKIKADFDYRMPRNAGNINSYANFVATRTKVENLLPFDRGGVAAIVEFGSRLVEDQRYLSTQFGEIKDLTIEADFIARKKGKTLINRKHVEYALDQKFHRLNLYEEQILEMVKSEDILLSVEGERVGQVNGLAVYDMGDYAFGKIGRITCTTSISDEGIFNIERASKLSGKIHDKGIYILTGFLNSLLAKEHSLGFSASVCFEQSYGLIDGDSATVAELVAIISAMADTPVKQNFALTGSLNQFGDVQPVGGINEKIEGFFKTCQLIGKGNKYHVLIPHQNAINLMLHTDARTAIRDGRLIVIPIKHISEAYELVTGDELGVKNVHVNKKFSHGSAMDRISKRLSRIHEEEDEHHHHVHDTSEKPRSKAAKSVW
jgi:lon-related putative ATP-dependent protease